MLKKLSVALSMAVLIMAMPVFASAEVELPNQVIPTKMTVNGMNCPRLGFGDKVVEKALSASPRETKNFTASINSIVWDAEAIDRSFSWGNVMNRSDINMTVGVREKNVCHYVVSPRERVIELKLLMKEGQVSKEVLGFTKEEERKKKYIRNLKSILEDAMKGGIISRADLLEIINKGIRAPTKEEELKAKQIKNVKSILEDIMKDDVISRAELLHIINTLAPQ